MTAVIVLATVFGLWAVVALVSVIPEAIKKIRARGLDAMAREKLSGFDIDKERQEVLLMTGRYIRRSPSLPPHDILLPSRYRCPRCYARLITTNVQECDEPWRRLIQCTQFPQCGYRIPDARSNVDELLRHQNG